MSDITFRVKAHSENPTKTIAKARGFEAIIDEPQELNGTNDGPNPVEYTLIALSGCLNVMCHLVAKEMNFTLRGVKMNLSGVLDPDKHLGMKTAERAGYKRIEVDIIPDADADAATLEQWLKTIEERCPVSDNLTNPTPVHLTVGK
jgi:uncharacterized OsmC-like protein